MTRCLQQDKLKHKLNDTYILHQVGTTKFRDPNMLLFQSMLLHNAIANDKRVGCIHKLAGAVLICMISKLVLQSQLYQLCSMMYGS